MRRFEKISFKQANKENMWSQEYEAIILPQRATVDSAGYDFFAISQITLEPGETVRASTGVRVMMEDDEFLSLHIRSSLGIKRGIRLSNCTGIVDHGYYHSENEGHIQISLRNDGDEWVVINKGERVMQGIFCKFFITDDDQSENIRVGGIGSTGV